MTESTTISPVLNLLSESSLKAFFGATYYSRGKDYHATGAVSDFAITLVNEHNIFIFATVDGRDSYEVNVDLNWIKSKSMIDVDGICTCPMMRNCKHVVATLLEAIEKNKERQQKSIHQDDFELTRWLSNLDHAVFSLPRASLFSPVIPPIKKSGRFFCLFSLKSTYHHNPDVQISLYFNPYLKSGKLGVGKPFQVSQHREFLDETSKALFMDLEGMCGIHHQNNHYYQKVKQYHLVGEEGEAILKKILANHNGYVEKEFGIALKQGDEKIAQWQWAIEDDGLQTLQYHSEQAALRLFKIQHLWYFNEKTGEIGRLQSDLDLARIHLLSSMPKIPPHQAEAVANQLLKHQKLLPIESPKLPADETLRIVKPVPCLSLFQSEITEPPSFKNNYLLTSTQQAVAVLKFDYDGLLVTEENKQNVVPHVENNKMIRIQRNRAKETEWLDTLKSYGWTMIKDLAYFHARNTSIPQYFIMDTDQHDPVHFTGSVLPELARNGWRIDITEDYPYQIVTDDIDDWYSAIEEESSGYDWFGLELGITLKGEKINLLPILQNILKKLPSNNIKDWIAQQTDSIFAELPDGRYIALPADRIRHILTIFIELYDTDALSDEQKLRLSKLHAMRLLELETAMGAAQLRWLGGERLRKMGQKLAQFSGIKVVQPSANFKGELRPYQVEGLSWLQFLREYELSGILADDMGLGKTVQTLAHLLREKVSHRMKAPCLIIAPTSLMFNWCEEAKRFAPNLKVLLLHGSARQAFFNDIATHDLILTTYPLLVRDQAILLEQEFYYFILDEAQFIKNAKSQAAQIALQIKAKHRLCLTGTPMENHLGELWSLFHFMMPGLLGEQKQFNRLFRTPIEKQGDTERRGHLNRRVAPFLLRRTKDKVMQELPEKVHIIRHVELEGPQRDLYETIRVTMEKKVRRQIARLGLSRSHIIILEALLKLRQVCCDPRLLKIPAAQKKKAKSAKLILLMELLMELLEEGRRILLFSQFTEMLGLIEEELHQRNITYVKLTGQTKDRQTPVQQFQKGEVPLFIISLKAGGTGLNLTAADTVIHYDPWWNPAVENQATDRAHRIGQNKTVFVYKLVTKGTVEEKILEMQERKRALLDGLFSEDATANKLKLTESDLQHLLDPLE